MDACKCFLVFSATEEPVCVAWHLLAENYPFPSSAVLLSLVFLLFWLKTLSMTGPLFNFCIQIFTVLLNGSELFLSRQW